MFRPNSLVKVLDFGLAKLAPLGAAFTGEEATRAVVRTEAGSVVGTTANALEQPGVRTWTLGRHLVAGHDALRDGRGQASLCRTEQRDVLAAILDREPVHWLGSNPALLWNCTASSERRSGRTKSSVTRA